MLDALSIWHEARFRPSTALGLACRRCTAKALAQAGSCEHRHIASAEEFGVDGWPMEPVEGATLARRGLALPIAGFVMTGAGWGAMWGVVSFWNPVAFAAMWTGAALLLWWTSGRYPGAARHSALAAISVPVWWWFELVNQRVENWEYVNPFKPGPFWYAVLASTAFATVVPALCAATAVLRSCFGGGPELSGVSRRLASWEVGLGVVCQASVFAYPKVAYPFVWIAPFLVIDGLGGMVTGRSLLADMKRGRWGEAMLLGGAGLLCGVLWEFWNYWSTPRWIYHVPLLGFGKVFEMPILGYLGYVPFAWSLARLVDLLDRHLPRDAIAGRDRGHR